MTDNYFKRIPLEGQDQETEIWKNIPDFPGYQVSNLGRVRSFWSIGNSASIQPNFQRIMSPNAQISGHLSVHMRRHTGFYKRERIHRLVLEAFDKPCPEGMECRHLDGNCKNNKLNNLKWDTHKINEADKVIHGTQPRGENHKKSKLTDKQIFEIRTRFDQGENNRILAKEFKLNPNHLNQILNGATRIDAGGPIQKPGALCNLAIKRGEDNFHAVLTKEMVLQIRERVKNKEKQNALSKEFRVSLSTINSIVKRRSWKHI